MQQSGKSNRTEESEMAEKKEKSIEESFAALDEMVKKLENEDISLEESFKTYEEGMKLLKDVNGSIDTVEKKMQKIAGDGTTEEFT
jgi:exodeoxyribonuclease VII small subunit